MSAITSDQLAAAQDAASVFTEVTLRYRGSSERWVARYQLGSRVWTTSGSTTPTNALRDLSAEIRSQPTGTPR